MSTTQISFSAVLKVGEETVPLLSEIVFGDSNSQDGVSNGFLFKLNRQPEDPPVTVYLGDVIAFIEGQLGVGSGGLASNPGMDALSVLFKQPDANITPESFNSSNQLLVNIYEFTINSTDKEFLFSINIDVEGADPTKGLIALPGELNNWVKINSLGISFSATSKSPS
ncbi:MAG: hypothetical protein CTY16_20665 [Methylobacter sp.]|nr:MAG: hypothetical protein CTY16_20665 [Methylobacter sp.]